MASAMDKMICSSLVKRCLARVALQLTTDCSWTIPHE